MHVGGLPRPEKAAVRFGLSRAAVRVDTDFLDRWFCYHLDPGRRFAAAPLRFPWARLLGPFGAESPAHRNTKDEE